MVGHARAVGVQQVHKNMSGGGNNWRVDGQRGDVLLHQLAEHRVRDALDATAAQPDLVAAVKDPWVIRTIHDC